MAYSPSSGSTVVSANTKSIFATAHVFSVGNWLYLSAANTYALADADAVLSTDSVGVVSSVTDANNFILATDGYVTGLTGLTAATRYYISGTAGAITSTAPTNAKAVFISDTTTSGWIQQFKSGQAGQVLTYGATTNWDASLGEVARLTLTGNTTLANPTNVAVGKVYTLILTASGGDRLVTFGNYNTQLGDGINLRLIRAATTQSFDFVYDGANMVEVGASADGSLLTNIAATGPLFPNYEKESHFDLDIIAVTPATITIPAPTVNEILGHPLAQRRFLTFFAKSSVSDNSVVFPSFFKDSDGVNIGTVVVPAGTEKHWVFRCDLDATRATNIVATGSAFSVVETRAALSALTPADKDVVFVQDTAGLNPGLFIYDSARAFGDVEPSTALKYLVTFDDTLDIVTTSVPHTLTAGTIVRFSDTAPANPLSINTNTTDYYVINPTATTFQVSLTNGGVAVNLLSTGNPVTPHYVSTKGGWFYPKAQVADTIHQFYTYDEYQTDNSTAFKVGDWVNVFMPRQSYQVTQAGTGFANIETQQFQYDPQGTELANGYQFSDSFTPDAIKYGRNYYGVTTNTSAQPLVIGDMESNGVASHFPVPGEKVQFVIFNYEATDKVIQFDPYWKDSTGTAIANQTVPANGQIRIDFEGNWTNTLPEFRQVVSSGGAFDEVANFAALAALSATTGDTKMVTNEDGRQYLLRYDSNATYGLVPSSGTVQPGVEIIGWDVVPNNAETASAHGLAVNDAIVIRSASSTTLVFEGDVVNGQTYYVKTVPTATTFTISATLGGAEIVFGITMGSPQNSGCFVHTPGWWNVVSGGSQTYNEKYLTPRIIDANDKAVEIYNSEGIIYWNTTRATGDYNTILNPGGISVGSLSQNAFADMGVNAFIGQDNVENTRISIQAVNAAMTEPWIFGQLANVDKLSIYTYPGTPETFITANIGAVCFDTTNGLIYRKTTSAVATGWTNDQLLSTKTANYTFTEADNIIEVDTTASAVQITVPSTLSTGKSVTVIWVAGGNACTVTSPFGLVDFDGSTQTTVTAGVIQTAYNWKKGSLRYQLV